MNHHSGSPAIRTVAMPSDTNPAGDIFGGWLMSQMDLAAGNVAARRAKGRCATVKVETMTFLTPVKVGDEVSVYAVVTRVGRTSLSLAVEAWRRPRENGENQKVTEGVFVFIALDGQGRPRTIAPSCEANQNESNHGKYVKGIMNVIDNNT
jgi:acyl-CoA thioesterase YciA